MSVLPQNIIDPSPLIALVQAYQSSINKDVNKQQHTPIQSTPHSTICDTENLPTNQLHKDRRRNLHFGRSKNTRGTEQFQACLGPLVDHNEEGGSDHELKNAKKTECEKIRRSRIRDLTDNLGRALCLKRPFHQIDVLTAAHTRLLTSMKAEMELNSIKRALELEGIDYSTLLNRARNKEGVQYSKPEGVCKPIKTNALDLQSAFTALFTYFPDLVATLAKSVVKQVPAAHDKLAKSPVRSVPVMSKPVDTDTSRKQGSSTVDQVNSSRQGTCNPIKDLTNVTPKPSKQALTSQQTVPRKPIHSSIDTPISNDSNNKENVSPPAPVLAALGTHPIPPNIAYAYSQMPAQTPLLMGSNPVVHYPAYPTWPYQHPIAFPQHASMHGSMPPAYTPHVPPQFNSLPLNPGHLMQQYLPYQPPNNYMPIQPPNPSCVDLNYLDSLSMTPFVHQQVPYQQHQPTVHYNSDVSSSSNQLGSFTQQLDSISNNTLTTVSPPSTPLSNKSKSKPTTAKASARHKPYANPKPPLPVLQKPVASTKCQYPLSNSQLPPVFCTSPLIEPTGTRKNNKTDSKHGYISSKTSTSKGIRLEVSSDSEEDGVGGRPNRAMNKPNKAMLESCPGLLEDLDMLLSSPGLGHPGTCFADPLDQCASQDVANQIFSNELDTVMDLLNYAPAPIDMPHQFECTTSACSQVWDPVSFLVDGTPIHDAVLGTGGNQQLDDLLDWDLATDPYLADEECVGR